MSHSVAGPPEHGSFRKLWYATAFAGGVAFLLSAWGFSLDSSGSLRHRVATVLYASVQLLLLHSEENSNDLKLDVAKILAALAVGATAVLTLLQVFRKSAALFMLDWRKGHVIVCGLGTEGIEVAKEFRRRRRTVVVVEKDPDNEFIPTAAEAGALILIGDAADSLMLRKARLHRAAYLMAFSGDDGANMEIVAHAGAALKAMNQPLGHLLRGCVRLVDLDLRTLFRQQQPRLASTDRMTVGIFNPFESSARLLFDTFPLDPPGLDAADPRSVHLVVIGFGQMGRAVTLQAAKLGHFGNGKKLVISIFDKCATTKSRKFEAEFPSFGVTCTADFKEGDVETPEVFERLAELSHEEDSIVTFVVCFDDDGRSFSCGLKLLQKLRPGTRIRLRLSSSRGFAALLPAADEFAALPTQLHAFGQVDRVATVEMVIGEQIDLLAKQIHSEFIRKRKLEGRTPETDSAILPWEVLNEDFIESNRQQADHIAVKLRAIGCRSSLLRKDEKPVEFSDAELELLARMEHARWNAERSLAGWTFAPGNKDPNKKTSPYLVEWNKLPEFVRKYDFEAVRTIPKLLASINQSIYR